MPQSTMDLRRSRGEPSFLCLCTPSSSTLRSSTIQAVPGVVVAGPPRPIFGRKDHQSGSHITSMPSLPSPCSILQNPGNLCSTLLLLKSMMHHRLRHRHSGLVVQPKLCCFADKVMTRKPSQECRTNVLAVLPLVTALQQQWSFCSAIIDATTAKQKRQVETNDYSYLLHSMAIDSFLSGSSKVFHLANLLQ